MKQGKQARNQAGGTSPPVIHGLASITVKVRTATGVRERHYPSLEKAVQYLPRLDARLNKQWRRQRYVFDLIFVFEDQFEAALQIDAVAGGRNVHSVSKWLEYARTLSASLAKTERANDQLYRSRPGEAPHDSFYTDKAAKYEELNRRL